MKAKLLKVAAVLMTFAATGLAEYPLDLLNSTKCC